MQCVDLAMPADVDKSYGVMDTWIHTTHVPFDFIRTRGVGVHGVVVSSVQCKHRKSYHPTYFTKALGSCEHMYVDITTYPSIVLRHYAMVATCI